METLATSTQLTKSRNQTPRKIKPIIDLYSVTLLSKQQLKTLQKKNYRVRTLKIPSIDTFYVSSGYTKVFVRPKATYLKSLKTLTGLETSRLWIGTLWIFSPLQNRLCNIRRFAAGINPEHSKLKKFRTFINRMKKLTAFQDLFRFEENRERKLLKIWPCPSIKQLNFSPNVDMTGFPRIKYLEIFIRPAQIQNLLLPNSIEEITLIDLEPQSRMDYGHKFYLIVKDINKLPALKSLNLIFPFKNYYQRIFKDLTVKNVTLRLSIDHSSLIEPALAEQVKEFIKKTQSRVVVVPRNCSNDQYVSLLAYMEKNFEGYQRSFYVESLSYNFHSLYEVQNRVINYYIKMFTFVKQVTFSFNINSLDWFNNPWRAENWKTMFELVYKHMSQVESSKVVYNINFVNDVYQDTLVKIIEQAASLVGSKSTNMINMMNRPYVEMNISVESSKTVDGLTLFLDKSLSLSPGIDLLTCVLDSSLFKKYYDTVASVLRQLNSSKVLPRFGIHSR